MYVLFFAKFSSSTLNNLYSLLSLSIGNNESFWRGVGKVGGVQIVAAKIKNTGEISDGEIPGSRLYLGQQRNALELIDI